MPEGENVTQSTPRSQDASCSSVLPQPGCNKSSPLSQPSCEKSPASQSSELSQSGCTNIRPFHHKHRRHSISSLSSSANHVRRPDLPPLKLPERANKPGNLPTGSSSRGDVIFKLGELPMQMLKHPLRSARKVPPLKLSASPQARVVVSAPCRPSPRRFKSPGKAASLPAREVMSAPCRPSPRKPVCSVYGNLFSRRPDARAKRLHLSARKIQDHWRETRFSVTKKAGDLARVRAVFAEAKERRQQRPEYQDRAAEQEQASTTAKKEGKQAGTTSKEPTLWKLRHSRRILHEAVLDVQAAVKSVRTLSRFDWFRRREQRNKMQRQLVSLSAVHMFSCLLSNARVSEEEWSKLMSALGE